MTDHSGEEELTPGASVGDVLAGLFGWVDTMTEAAGAMAGGAHAPLAVYVPRPDSAAGAMIERGSGVVGSPAADGLILIDYQGSDTPDPQHQYFVGRVFHAAGRHSAGSPTRARATVPSAELIEVGSFDGRRVTVTDGGALAAWLGGAPVEAELVFDRSRR